LRYLKGRGSKHRNCIDRNKCGLESVGLLFGELRPRYGDNATSEYLARLHEGNLAQLDRGLASAIRRKYPRLRTALYPLVAAAVAGLYIGTAKLGIELPVARGVVTPVWAPTGIALAALVLFGPALWPAVALGALVGQRDERRVVAGRRIHLPWATRWKPSSARCCFAEWRSTRGSSAFATCLRWWS
jgi:hypothetical protein